MRKFCKDHNETPKISKERVKMKIPHILQMAELSQPNQRGRFSLSSLCWEAISGA